MCGDGVLREVDDDVSVCFLEDAFPKFAPVECFLGIRDRADVIGLQDGMGVVARSPIYGEDFERARCTLLGKHVQNPWQGFFGISGGYGNGNVDHVARQSG